ncbi:putative gpi anchored protein [Botrytis cinerea BcDW1]|uniref:Putative gpi anchored protein n=1 Tax=Botryotinia fuckeliana (strain BcDW1) TaxID=1290391 RepID=M7U8E7_BOTF1|nr:putative gpi anchored protein [Botrytis cinerea BcDW1]
MFLPVDFLYIFLVFCVDSRGVVAQSSTTLFAGDYPVVAYAIGSTANVATTYLMACPAGSNPSTCNFQQPYTLTQGPSTVQYAMTFSGSTTMTLGCALSGSASMTCQATELIPGTTKFASTTITGAAATSQFRPISIATDSVALLTYAVVATTATSSSAIASSSSAAVSETSSAKSTTITSAPILVETSNGNTTGTIGTSSKTLLPGTATPLSSLSSVAWSSSSPTASSVAPTSSSGAGVRNGAGLGSLGVMCMIGMGALGL